MISKVLRNRFVLLVLSCLLFWISLWYFVSTAYKTGDVWASQDDETYNVAGGAIVETSLGNIKINFFKTGEPDAVKNFIVGADQDAYNGTILSPVETGLVKMTTKDSTSDYFILTQDSASWLKNQYQILGNVSSGTNTANELPSQTKPVVIDKVLITP